MDVMQGSVDRVAGRVAPPAGEMVCSCVYPWVNGQWDADCNGRLYNVIWSGLI